MSEEIKRKIPPFNRVDLKMTLGEAMDVVCDGDPEALRIFGLAAHHYADVNKKALMVGMCVRTLDGLEIYGRDIIRFYEGVCGRSIETFIQLLNGWGFDFVDGEELKRFAKEGVPDGFDSGEYHVKIARRIVELRRDAGQHLEKLLSLLDKVSAVKSDQKTTKESL